MAQFIWYSHHVEAILYATANYVNYIGVVAIDDVGGHG